MMSTLRRRLPALVPFVGAALLLRWGRPIPAAIAVFLGLVCLIPAVGRRVGQGTARLATVVGNGLAAVVFAVVWAVMILPAGVVARVLRLDPLFARTSAGGWRVRTPESTPHSHRQFADLPDPRPLRRAGGLQRAWNLTGALVVLALLNYLAGWAWEGVAGPRGGSGPGTALDLHVVGFPAPTTVPPFDRARFTWPPDPIPNWLLSGRLGSLDRTPWAPEYVYDMNQRDYMPVPYLGLKPVPLRTRYVNMSGWERRTYSPKRLPPDAPVVWIFGGSTTWGVGQRDEHTIPSELARAAERAGTPIVVRNFGQVTWLNWQEMLLFEQLLSTERRLPDLVLFYDGVNEFALPPPYDQPAPRSFAPNAVEFDSISESGVSFRSVLDAYRRRSFVSRLWHVVRDAVDPPAGATVVDRDPPDPEWGPDDEIRAAARNYDRGAAIIESLARAHRIPVVLLWQPRLATVERHHAIRDHITAPLVDVSDALDRHPEVYLDDMHTDEVGARIVARRLWKVVAPQLERPGQSGSKTTSPPVQGG